MNCLISYYLNVFFYSLIINTVKLAINFLLHLENIRNESKLLICCYLKCWWIVSVLLSNVTK